MIPLQRKIEFILLLMIFGLSCFIGGQYWERWNNYVIIHSSLGTINHCIEQLHSNVGENHE